MELPYLNGTLAVQQVADAEKLRERERRQAAREDKLAEAKAEHELRVQRALERAAAPVFKKTGKPVMYRSSPPKRKVGVSCCITVPCSCPASLACLLDES